MSRSRTVLESEESLKAFHSAVAESIAQFGGNVGFYILAPLRQHKVFTELFEFDPVESGQLSHAVLRVWHRCFQLFPEVFNRFADCISILIRVGVVHVQSFGEGLPRNRKVRLLLTQ